MGCLRSWALGLAVMLGFGAASAQNKLVEVESTGYGRTQTEAVSDALAKAVAQINGASVGIDTTVKSTALEGVSTHSTGATDSFTASVNQSQTAGFKARGQVDSYEVIASDAVDGAIRVTVRARVIRYSIPGGDSSRRRMAIMPAGSSAGKYDIFGAVSGHDFGDELVSAVESRLVQSRRFSVLDRTTLNASLAELSLIGSDLTSADEKAKLGRIKGADYILIPRIVSAAARTIEETRQTTGQVVRRTEGGLAVELRVVIPATGEVKFSDVYSVGVGSSRAAMVSAVADAAVRDLTGKIYPLRVVAVTGKEIVLNQGGDSVRIGERFDLIAEGAELKDPYTGESLGRTEVVVGRATVTRVEAKVAYANVTSAADPDAITQGLIARLAASASSNIPRPSPTAPPATTGIRLPFE